MSFKESKEISDKKIVRAAIYPGIGVARVGDAENAFYIGPEIVDAPPKEPSSYRDDSGALKREAAKFRLYGYNAEGQVVAELTPDNAEIEWSAHLVNSKSDWFEFITAMDIPETKELVLDRRNPAIKKEARKGLVIDGGERSISGKCTSGVDYAFNDGKFVGWDENIYLGELQTDEQGRLIVLGGHGVSKSPSGQPPVDPAKPNTFNNAIDWFDDIADGPVDATVSIDGETIPVKGAWVATAPPNYAPDIVGWRTMYDLQIDVYIGCGWLPIPEVTSFTYDVLPQLQRLSNLQWVNKGYQAMFGRGRPMDFNDPEFIRKLSQEPRDKGMDKDDDEAVGADHSKDAYGELRHELLNAFRPHDTEVNEPRLWPWIYGDSFDSDLFAESPRTMLDLPAVQELHLQRWAKGEFINDWDADAKLPTELSEINLQEQPDMLDKAAMHYCLADAFHPGCELTWPMRHATLYSEPFRIRRQPENMPVPDYGEHIDQKTMLSLNGPLGGQVAGNITRWMGLPWQGDTAYCRSGYDPSFDKNLPTFWPARVPNTVLAEDDYQIVMNTSLSSQERAEAYNRRQSWYLPVDRKGQTTAECMERMIAGFGNQGIVEARPGIADDPEFPETIYVQNLPPIPEGLLQAAEKSGDIYNVWGDDENRRAALALRARKPVK